MYDFSQFHNHVSSILNDGLSPFPKMDDNVNVSDWRNILGAVGKLSSTIRVSTKYCCNETGQLYGPMSTFLHIGWWCTGFIHVYDFMGRRQANRVTRQEKNNLAQYFGRMTDLKYKFILMSPTPAENNASRTYCLCAATMVSLALGHDPSHCTFDYSAFTDHMPNIIEHGLCEFPQIGDEPMNLTP